MNYYIRPVVLILCLLTLILEGNAFAEEITLVFSGQTHSMLYPCNCPKEPDGGIARRASLIKELRSKYPNLVLLDSGNFFAGGLLDQYTQNTDLDSQRSRINLKAMQLMGFDCVTFGDAEFNFGKQFMEETVAGTKIAFVSSNIEWDKIEPFFIKKIGGVKIGITGLSAVSSIQKAGGFKFTEPKAAVTKAVQELKKKNCDVIILLSNLTENEDEQLIKEVPDIDILISNMRSRGAVLTTINSVLVLRPSWQGRKLGRLTFVLKDKKIMDVQSEEIRLSDQIADDKEILAIMPRCFQDANCQKEGSVGSCLNAGTLKASCGFSQANKIPLLIITPQKCRICNTEEKIKSLKINFPGLAVSYFYFPGEKADGLIRSLGLNSLPVYLLGKEVEQEKEFLNFKDNLEKKGDYYMLKQHIAGLAFFLNRPKIEARLDLLLSLYGKDVDVLLERIKEFNPNIHFLVFEQQQSLSAPNGLSEVEESLRAVCVEKYYPGYFYNYISCRAKNKGSSWWEDCLGSLDMQPVKVCARGQEGLDLLRKNISLNKELQIANGPTYLINNQEIFSSVNVPSKEEFRNALSDK